jgi:hypothetical protein
LSDNDRPGRPDLNVVDRGVRKKNDRGEREAYQDERDPPAY